MQEDAIRVAESIRLLQKHLQCMICLEILQNPVSTRCGHSFCNMCVDNLFSKKKSALCPLCNASVTRRGIVANEKIALLVKCVRNVSYAAQKDIAEIGFNDIMNLESKPHTSTREAVSPAGQGTVNATNSTASKATTNKSLKVETWLSEMAGPSLTQESCSSVHTDPSPNEYSDGELISVSQVNTKTKRKSLRTTQSKHLSGLIEDGDADSDEPIPRKGAVKSKRKSTLKTPKETGMTKGKRTLQVASKQSNALSRGLSNDIIASVPDPVVVLLDGGKENPTDSPQKRSPGWSRIHKMKQEFHHTSKSFKSGNLKGSTSPLHTIEDAGSGEEEPCLNLSLDSPVLKKKAKMTEIVNNLESELQSYEQSRQATSPANEKDGVRTRRGNNIAKKSPFKALSIEQGVCRSKPIVRFLKLGPVAAQKSQCVPIYLKGSLEHMISVDIINMPHRVLVDAQTQTSCELLPNSAVQSSKKIQPAVTSTNKALSPKPKRLSGFNSDGETDIMDAETVVISQPPVFGDARALITSPNPKQSLQLSVKDDYPLLQTQESASFLFSQDNNKSPSRTQTSTVSHALEKNVLGTGDDNQLQSQESESIIFSEEVVKTPVKRAKTATLSYVAQEENAMNSAGDHLFNSQESESIIFSPEVERSPLKKTKRTIISDNVQDIDLNSSSSSINEKNSKRTRPVQCSSDSSDTDLEIRQTRTKKRKKTKSRKLSESEESSNADSTELPEISLLDQIDPAQIRANIEAGLKDTEGSQSPSDHLYSPEKQTISEPNPMEFGGLLDESRSQIDSDGDSDVINPTPQKQSSFISRNVTQSDDIVPSSQPPVVNQKSPISLLEGSNKENVPLEAPCMDQTGRKAPENKRQETFQGKDSCAPQRPTSLVQNFAPAAAPCIDQIGRNAPDSKRQETFQCKDSCAPQRPTSLVQNFAPAAAPCIDQIGRNAPDSKRQETFQCKDSCAPQRPTSLVQNFAPATANVKTTAKPSFVCSSLTAALASQVEKLARTVGGEFSSKFTPNVTHLVVRVDEENRADKTLKYLCAVAAGIWVVSYSWAQKCLEAGKLLPEEPYEALDASGEPGPRRSREARASGKKLFQNFEFCCIGDFPDLSKTQLEALLKDCGATVINGPNNFSFRDHVVPITLALEDEDREEEFCTWLHRFSAPLIQHEWVLECIGKFSVVSFAPMLLCDAAADVLQSMGIPPHLYESVDSEQ